MLSHVAAIMFKVESAVINGYTSITSGTCHWNQVFTKKVYILLLCSETYLHVHNMLYVSLHYENFFL